jgi:hypothetical protein
VLTFVNGLVAPTVLYCAGFAFAISFHRKWGDYTRLKFSFWRYLSRLLFIFVVAYSLHLPRFSLRDLLSVTDENAWLSFYQVDILQTISVTLILLSLLAILMRREKLFIFIAALVTVLVVFTAPIVREMDYSSFPGWLTPYFTLKVKSQFPLFPWSAFLMSGALIGHWFILASERGAGKVAMHRLALFAFAGIIISLVVEVLPMTIYPGHDFWRASPEFFFVRLGIVVLFMFTLWWREQRRMPAPGSYLSLFGQESLLVYTVHLLIVYGHTYQFSFVRVFEPTMGYAACFGLFAGLSVAMYLMAYGWHRLKGWNRQIAAYVQYAVLAGIVVAFVMR